METLNHWVKMSVEILCMAVIVAIALCITLGIPYVAWRFFEMSLGR